MSSEALVEQFYDYSALIEQSKVSSPSQSKRHFNTVLSFIREFSKGYKKHCRDVSVADKNRVLAFRIIYNLSQRLFGGAMTMGPRFLEDNKDFPNNVYNFYSKIVEIDLFITDEFRLFSYDFLVRKGIEPNLSYYNFLTHMMGFLASYSNQLRYGEQVKQFHKYSALWVEESKEAFPLGIELKEQIDTLIEKIARNS